MSRIETQYATYTTVSDALDVDETALWLAGIDGHRANRLEDLDEADQHDYRLRASGLNQYLTDTEDSASEA